MQASWYLLGNDVAQGKFEIFKAKDFFGIGEALYRPWERRSAYGSFIKPAASSRRQKRLIACRIRSYVFDLSQIDTDVAYEEVKKS